MHDTIQNFPSQFKSGLGSAKDFKLETKHDKIVEELAKSLGKSMEQKTATKAKTKSGASTKITIKKTKRQR